MPPVIVAVPYATAVQVDALLVPATAQVPDTDDGTLTDCMKLEDGVGVMVGVGRGEEYGDCVIVGVTVIVAVLDGVGDGAAGNELEGETDGVGVGCDPADGVMLGVGDGVGDNTKEVLGVGEGCGGRI